MSKWVIGLARSKQPHRKLTTFTTMSPAMVRITWHSLPYDIIFTICKSLTLRDLIAIQYLSDSCEEAANQHFKRRCATLSISRTMIVDLLAGMRCTPDFVAHVALLLTRVGRHVRQLTINLNAPDDTDDKLSLDNTADLTVNNTCNILLSASVECAVISVLVYDLCPSLRQYTLIGPHRAKMRRIVRVFTAPFQRIWFVHMEENVAPIERLVNQYRTEVANITQRIRAID